MPAAVDQRAHYDDLLAPIYTWMLGAPAAAAASARAQLDGLGVARARPGARALDLGAGPGVHAIALAALGYDVTALDTSRRLLDELVAVAPSVHAIEGDLARADELVTGGFDVVICLGDTLPHLASAAELDRALRAIARVAAPGARIALAFRDHVSPTEAERYVLVRADDDRVLTCRLAYARDQVDCTDIVHERRAGAWTLRTSTYRKLRLDGRAVADGLRAHDLIVDAAHVEAGVVSIVARRGA